MSNKDITPLNDKGQRHGLWEMYFFGGDSLWYKCFYHNGQEFGYEEKHILGNNKLREKKYHL